MFLLIFRAYLELLRLESALARHDFAEIYRRVKSSKATAAVPVRSSEGKIIRAAELACVLYFKEVLCLQRSAATTCLLRSHGLNASMVIGVQQIPFRAHAWVELQGRCVSDKSYIPEAYLVLDRC